MAKHAMALKQNSSTLLIGESVTVVRGSDCNAGISPKPSCRCNDYYCGANVNLAAVLLFRHYFTPLAYALHISISLHVSACQCVVVIALLLLESLFVQSSIICANTYYMYSYTYITHTTCTP